MKVDKVKEIVLIFLLIIFFSGCASLNPFYRQYQELNNAYNSGRITYAQYLQLKQGIQFQEQRYYDNIGQELQRINDQINQNLSLIHI